MKLYPLEPCWNSRRSYGEQWTLDWNFYNEFCFVYAFVDNAYHRRGGFRQGNSGIPVKFEICVQAHLIVVDNEVLVCYTRSVTLIFTEFWGLLLTSNSEEQFVCERFIRSNYWWIWAMLLARFGFGLPLVFSSLLCFIIAAGQNGKVELLYFVYELVFICFPPFSSFCFSSTFRGKCGRLLSRVGRKSWSLGVDSSTVRLWAGISACPQT